MEKLDRAQNAQFWASKPGVKGGSGPTPLPGFATECAVQFI